MSAQPGLTPEFVLAYRAIMLDGATRELETTKKVIAAIPDAKSDYKPDPNARSAWELAWHIANSDVQFLDGIADMKFDMETPEPADKPKSVSELLEWYESNFKRGAARVGEMSAEQLLTPVDFFGVCTLPSVFYLGFLNNHCIHHRGALVTYLRPMGAKVPSVYGGSYDEPFQPATTDSQAA
ncbi:MAG TPA: DinB family protein [Candidatus Aquilonibacter sp.]|nr:DinB family protein [Candidatus Aquilonibacter sp.]